jgi:hypothetical protein
MTLIEELYSQKAITLIKDLYYDDAEAKQSFYNAFGNKILESQHKILVSKPLDIIMFICSTANFANSPEESSCVAVMVYKRLKESNPLPYILDDKGIDLAEKILISLSFFKPAMYNRWKKGGPHPDFYRNYSKHIFASEGLPEIANNHERWENFFSEFFI